MAIIDFPLLYVPDPQRNRPLGNGQIYVGQPGPDPEVEANQKQLSVVQVDGTVTPVGQPFTLSMGGVPVYDGSTVRLDVDGNYSIKILDRNGQQVYYIQDVFEGTPVIVDNLPDYIAAEFETVSDMQSGDSLNLGSIDFSDYTQRKVSTTYNNDDSKSGGAVYIIKTAAQATADGDTADGYVNHYVGGTSDYVAVMDVNGTLIAEQAGMIPDYDGDILTATDNLAAYQAAVNYCGAKGFELVIGAGAFYTSGKITFPSTGFSLRGITTSSLLASVIVSSGNYVLHEHTSRFKCRDLRVRQVSGTKEGFAFSTPQSDASSAQSLYSSFENVFVFDFDFSWWLRASVWNTWKNCYSQSTIGIRFAKNADPFDVTSDAPAGWNIFSPSIGWFHNQGFIDNCVFEDSEVGIFGCAMGFSLRSNTTQGQDGDPADNTIIPITEERTGVWLDSGNDGVRNAWTNTFDGVNYAEVCRRPIFLKDQRYARCDGTFFQGGSSSDKFLTPVYLDNSAFSIEGATGQDWFDYRAVLRNNSTLFGNTAGAVTGNAVDVEDGSNFYINGEIEKFFCEYSFSIAAAGPSTLTIPDVLENRSFYRVWVGGLRDGSATRLAVFDIYYRQSGLSTIRTSNTAPVDPDILCTIPTNQVVIDWDDSLAFTGTVRIEKITELTTQSSGSITPT